MTIYWTAAAWSNQARQLPELPCAKCTPTHMLRTHATMFQQAYSSNFLHARMQMVCGQQMGGVPAQEHALWCCIGRGEASHICQSQILSVSGTELLPAPVATPTFFGPGVSTGSRWRHTWSGTTPTSSKPLNRGTYSWPSCMPRHNSCCTPWTSCLQLCETRCLNRTLTAGR